jgi:hypothetical protein
MQLLGILAELRVSGIHNGNPCGYAGRVSVPTLGGYRTTNWSACNAALRKRGSLLIWLDRKMTWLAPHDGRPSVFSNAATLSRLSNHTITKGAVR